MCICITGTPSLTAVHIIAHAALRGSGQLTCTHSNASMPGVLRLATSACNIDIQHGAIKAILAH